MIEVEETPDGRWAVLYKNKDGLLINLIVMTADEILDVFNKTVPRTIEETYLNGASHCEHSFRPWNFNSKFMRCNKCWAMKLIKKLVPLQYD